MKCPRCGTTLTKPRARADGLAGIKYADCRACGYTVPQAKRRPTKRALVAAFGRGTPGRKCEACGQGGGVMPFAGHYFHPSCFRASRVG